MIIVYNTLNQPLTIGDRHVSAGGSIRVKAVDDDIERLAAAGHVTVAEDTPPEPPKGKESTDGGKNK